MNQGKSDKHKIIKDFIKDNKPLYVYGGSGSGKTTISNDILKDYIVEKIDTYDIRNHKNIYDFLVENAKKRNISLMFSGDYKKRAFFIDDLDVFYKNDKKSFKGILRFIKEKRYNNCKIVITFNEFFIKNKELIKIDHYKYYINNENIHLKKQLTKKKQVYKPNKDDIKVNDIDYSHLLNDIQYTINGLFNNLICKDKDIREIINANLGDENQFLLNLLENIENIVEKKRLIQMYENYIFYDRIELYSTGNHLWELKEYSKNIILRGIYIYTLQRKIDMKNNSYISKSILTMSSSRFNIDDGYIYFFIALFVNKKKDKKKETKEIEKMKKIYYYFYS